MEGSAPLILISTMLAIDSTDRGREAIGKFAAHAPPHTVVPADSVARSPDSAGAFLATISWLLRSNSVLLWAPFARTCLKSWLLFTWEMHYCAQCTGVCCLSRAGGAPMPVQISDDEGRDRQKLDL